MNHKIFYSVSVFLLSAMLVLNLGYVQAGTPGRIPKFDAPGTGGCDISPGANNNCSDSVITEDGGNIGIGTTTPAAKLHTVGAAPFNGTGVITSGTFGDIIGSGTQFTTELHIGDAILAGGQTRLVQSIQSDTALSVLIQFSPPLSGAPFTVQQPIIKMDDSAGRTQFMVNSFGEVGNVRIGTAVISTGSPPGTPPGSRFAIWDGRYRFLIDEDGFVGIGTTSPLGKLDVIGGTPMTFGFPALRAVNPENGPGIYAYGNPALSVDGRAEFFGNVGIGTSSPAAKLDSVASTAAESTLTAVRGYQAGAGTWGGIGVWGYSGNGTGVLGRTDNFSFPGVEAQSYQAAATNLAFRALGQAAISGKMWIDGGGGTNYSLGISNRTGNGKGISWGWDQFSSRRWKTNIQAIQGALEKVERLRGVSFDWKEKGGHDIGLIAEEVGEVIPEVVSYEENGKDAMGLDYARLTALLIEAVKEQQSQIRELKAELKGLKVLERRTVELEEKDAEIADLKARLEALEGMVRNAAYRTAWSGPTE